MAFPCVKTTPTYYLSAVQAKQEDFAALQWYRAFCVKKYHNKMSHVFIVFHFLTSKSLFRAQITISNGVFSEYCIWNFKPACFVCYVPHENTHCYWKCHLEVQQGLAQVLEQGWGSSVRRPAWHSRLWKVPEGSGRFCSQTQLSPSATMVVSWGNRFNKGQKHQKGEG